jgi:hypothetical protein
MAIFDHIDETLASFDTGFTTHELILALAKDHQREYIEALAQQTGLQPFKSLHSRIGEALSKNPSVTTFTSIRSKNIFGDPGTSPVWQRAA